MIMACDFSKHKRDKIALYFAIICLSLACYTEQQKMSDSEEKKRYDRDFLLGCQFISASMHKPEGLPIISDVVLDKVCGV